MASSSSSGGNQMNLATFSWLCPGLHGPGTKQGQDSIGEILALALTRKMARDSVFSISSVGSTIDYSCMSFVFLLNWALSGHLQEDLRGVPQGGRQPSAHPALPAALLLEPQAGLGLVLGRRRGQEGPPGTLFSDVARFTKLT